MSKSKAAEMLPFLRWVKIGVFVPKVFLKSILRKIIKLEPILYGFQL